MGTSAVQVPLSYATRARSRRSPCAPAEAGGGRACLIEGALAVDVLELEIIRRRLAEAEAGGPIARHRRCSPGSRRCRSLDAHPPKATMMA